MRMRKIAAILLALILALGFVSGCSNQQQDPPDTPSEDKMVFSGDIITLSQDELTVQGEKESMTFEILVTTELNGAHDLSEGDTVDVEYILGNGKAKAVRITVVRHVPKVGRFTGIVVDATNNTVTLQLASGNEAHTFLIDDTTTIDGSLTEGDEAEIVYYGDIEQTPLAVSIKVNNEKPAPEVLELSGTVSDVSSTALTVNIGSDHSYTFAITNSTVISGAAKSVKKGYKVTVGYTGELSGQPVASEIKITEAKEQQTTSKINGVVTAIASNGFSANTGSNNTYFFIINSSTVWSGASMAVGCNVEVTYTGSVSSKATATNVIVTAAPAPTPPTPPAPTPTYSASGVVDYVATNGFAANVNGTSYYFVTNSGTKWGGTTSLGEQCNVDITYTGNIASNPVAKRVDVYPPTPEPPQPTGWVSGTVDSIYAAGFSINVDGTIYGISTDESTLWGGTTSLEEDCNVDVLYYGDLYSNPLADEVDVYPPTPVPVPVPPVVNPMHTENGYVYDLRTEDISVLFDGGVRLMLYTDSCEFEDVPDIGDYVQVVYNAVTGEAKRISVLQPADPVVITQQDTPDEGDAEPQMGLAYSED